MSNATMLQAKFEQGLPYAAFVAGGEPEGHRPPWDQRYAQLELDTGQRCLVESFQRTMHVLCLDFLQSNGRWFRVDETMEGWSDLMANISQRFSSFDFERFQQIEDHPFEPARAACWRST